jgi:hypothetical protein
MWTSSKSLRCWWSQWCCCVAQASQCREKRESEIYKSLMSYTTSYDNPDFSLFLAKVTIPPSQNKSAELLFHFEFEVVSLPRAMGSIWRLGGRVLSFKDMTAKKLRIERRGFADDGQVRKCCFSFKKNRLLWPTFPLSSAAPLSENKMRPVTRMWFMP